MSDYFDDICVWETELASKNISRKNKKKIYDPLKDRYYTHRKVLRGRPRVMKETKINRKLAQGEFRTRMKNYIYNECELSVVPHEYRTYGWRTW